MTESTTPAPIPLSATPRAQLSIGFYENANLLKRRDAMLTWTADDRIRIDLVGTDKGYLGNVLDAPIADLQVQGSAHGLAFRYGGRLYATETSDWRADAILGAAGSVAGVSPFGLLSTPTTETHWVDALKAAGAKTSMRTYASTFRTGVIVAAVIVAIAVVAVVVTVVTGN